MHMWMNKMIYNNNKDNYNIFEIKVFEILTL